VIGSRTNQENKGYVMGLPVEADNEHPSDLSNQWCKNVRKRSSFHHHDIILVGGTAAAKGGFYLNMSQRVMSNYTLTLSVSFFESLARRLGYRFG
jgi:hypothetical protein